MTDQLPTDGNEDTIPEPGESETDSDGEMDESGDFEKEEPTDAGEGNGSTEAGEPDAENSSSTEDHADDSDGADEPVKTEQVDESTSSGNGKEGSSKREKDNAKNTDSKSRDSGKEKASPVGGNIKLERENTVVLQEEKAPTGETVLPQNGTGVSSGQSKTVTIPSVSGGITNAITPSSQGRKLVKKTAREYSLTDKVVRTTSKKVESDLNVRIGKGTEFSIAGRIKKDGVFFLISDTSRNSRKGKEDEWVFIETEDAGHHVLRGYVKAELITEDKAEKRLKEYGDRYRSYVKVAVTEKDNPVFGDIKKTVYEHLVESHTTISYEWVSDTGVTGNGMTASVNRQQMVNYSKQFLGNPYVWGGESLTDGCDCSGFTMQIYHQFGIELPRCSYEQAEVGTKIDPKDALPGDLLFYERNGEIYHVLMCIGGGQAINASSSTTGIIISNVDYDKTCWGVRLFDDTSGKSVNSGILDLNGRTIFPADKTDREKSGMTFANASVSSYATDSTNYSEEDLELIWAIVAQEDDKSYEGALAVISSAMNRADVNYGGYGTTVLEQLTADGQYCYSPKVSDSSLYQRRLGGNVADYVIQAVSDCLKLGIRNNDFLNFRSSDRTGNYTKIGDNWYF